MLDLQSLKFLHAAVSEILGFKLMHCSITGNSLKLYLYAILLTQYVYLKSLDLTTKVGNLLSHKCCGTKHFTLWINKISYQHFFTSQKDA